MARERASGLMAGVLTTLTAAAASAVGRTAILTGTSFIDRQGTAADFLAGQSRDGCLGAFGGAHGDKSEAAGTAAHAIGDEVDFGDWPVSREKILEIIFGCVEG
jgi:hypothetical protein